MADGLGSGLAVALTTLGAAVAARRADQPAAEPAPVGGTHRRRHRNCRSASPPCSAGRTTHRRTDAAARDDGPASADGSDEIAQVAQAFASVQPGGGATSPYAQAELRLDLTGDRPRRWPAASAPWSPGSCACSTSTSANETDPEALARLFALDHLAARLRRNGDNLLVLAGADPVRGHPGGYHLSEVVAAAASEIENFDPGRGGAAGRGGQRARRRAAWCTSSPSCWRTRRASPRRPRRSGCRPGSPTARC